MGVSDFDGFPTPEPPSGQDEAQLAEWDLRHALTVVLYSLPSSHTITPGIPRYDQGDLAEWLAGVTAWLAEYKKFLDRIMEIYNEQGRQLGDLSRLQLDLQVFLGTDKGE